MKHVIPDENRGPEIPRWHFTMLRDAERNGAIASAIAGLDLNGKTVVEIGTGAGLPAMLFAKSGAKHVFTCEMNQQLAEIAKKVIQRNGFQDRITVIPKSSRDAINDGNLPIEPDVIFTETLDCGVVGEGFYPISEDVRQLAGQMTIILPGRVRQIGVLCCDQDAFERNSVYYESGLDLAELNELSKKNYFEINPNLHKSILLSPPFLVREYSYLDKSCINDRVVSMIATRSAVCHGMTSYFNAEFGDFTVSSKTPNTHWSHAFHPLSDPVTLKKGDNLDVMIAGDGSMKIKHKPPK